ncbi:MAG: nucleotide exchange factor GrpE [Nitrospinae bacterium RIFCSPLOWO2_12_FULL_47_7]|nr:MAG: nucleotide exchange factor GrpE [Nitrospinae bacterium RIFCSPLOWO2_12_FULL_47_7]
MNEGESATEEPRIKTEADIIQELKDQLQAKEDELKEERNQVLRVRAETDNFKKRLLKEKSELSLFANEKLIKELLPIYENMERALTSPDINIRSLKEGVQMIFKQFTSFLEKEKIETIVALGEKFDPSRHEALKQIELDTHDENTVVEEYSKGYLLHGRVLLPARVVISKKNAPSSGQGNSEITEL